MATKFNPPWHKKEWRSDAEAWIAEQLADRGLRATAPSEQIHLRPWSTVLCVPTNEGDLFFKAGGPTQKFEPGLLKLLNMKRPNDVLPLLAADPLRGWSLLPDGGPTLRKANDGKPNLVAWLEILPRYAKMQIGSADWLSDLENVGVPNRRVSKLPTAYVDILNDAEAIAISEEEDALNPDQHARLVKAAPVVEQMAAELDSFGIPAALEHGDLHDGNIFAIRKIYDWGDAAITHPFFTFLLPLRFMAHKLGVSEYDQHPDLLQLRDAYFKPWAALAPYDRVLEAWQLAHHLSKFQRTIGWYQVVKTTAGLEREDELSVSGWFLEFLNHPTDRF
jgi:hypothetical protein